MEMFGKTLGEIQDEFRDESEKASEVCHITALFTRDACVFIYIRQTSRMGSMATSDSVYT